MIHRITNGIELHFPPDEAEAAQIIDETCKKSIPLIHDTWGLAPPKRCRVYVMTSFLAFMFASAPWYRLIPLAITMPFWFFRIRRLWRFAGGWMLRYRNTPAIGVKPPRLIAQSDTSVGEKIFIKEPDLNKKVAHIACHELTHAFSAHLRLPLWLNEGIAMVAVDTFFGRPTVRTDSLQSLNQPTRKRSAGKYAGMSTMKKEDVVYHYARGYWITRYLMDTRPGLVKGLLQRRRRHWATEKRIANALGLSLTVFRREIDALVVEHFSQTS